jgi:hypothetical protein
MNHDCPGNAKFGALQAALNLERYEVVGILESLWILVKTSLPQGDIGKYTNERIAASIGWRKPADELVNQLVITGWLDEHPEHRLVVHDWGQHAPQYIRRRLERKGLRFANEDCEMASHDYSQLDMTSHDYPKLVMASKGNETKRNITKHNKDSRQLPVAEDGVLKEKKSKPKATQEESSEFVEAWNAVAATCGLPTSRADLGDKRREMLHARLKDSYYREHWKEALGKIPLSHFLCGRSKTSDWQANPEWFLRPDSVTKLMEGSYGTQQQGAYVRANDDFEERMLPLDCGEDDE